MFVCSKCFVPWLFKKNALYFKFVYWKLAYLMSFIFVEMCNSLQVFCILNFFIGNCVLPFNTDVVSISVYSTII